MQNNLFFNRLFVAILTADNLDDAKCRFKKEQATIQQDFILLDKIKPRIGDGAGGTFV